MVIRDAPIIPNIHPPDINEAAGGSFAGVVSSVNAGAAEVSAATSAAQGAIHAQLTELKSHLFQYYYVGLWGYCKSRNGSKVVCSEPRTSFSFDLSAVLDSTPVEVDKVLPKVDQKAISGYRQLSHGIIGLYISGFITTVLVVILGVRRTFLARGSKLLALFCIVSDTEITLMTRL